MSAWVQYYKRTQPLTWGHDDAYGYACKSIKNELIYNGFTDGVDPEKQVIGLQAEDAIKAFQTAHGLTADGIVGPNTARALYHKRAADVEQQYSIPDSWLSKIKSLESANDPGAIGSTDPDDHGLVQINLRFHPAVTLEQAEDGQYSLDFAGSSLKSAHGSMNDWEGAVASWNVGTYWATRWVRAGKPTNGGVSGSIDYYARATDYVANVKKQTY